MGLPRFPADGAVADGSDELLLDLAAMMTLGDVVVDSTVPEGTAPVMVADSGVACAVPLSCCMALYSGMDRDTVATCRSVLPTRRICVTVGRRSWSSNDTDRSSPCDTLAGVDGADDDVGSSTAPPPTPPNEVSSVGTATPPARVSIPGEELLPSGTPLLLAPGTPAVADTDADDAVPAAALVLLLLPRVLPRPLPLVAPLVAPRLDTGSATGGTILLRACDTADGDDGADP